MPGWKSTIRKSLNSMGWDLRRYVRAHTLDHQRARVISERRVDVVMDVGANEGQWAAQLREEGYAGRIISVEPVRQAFDNLERKSAGDPHWEVARMALGNFDGSAEMDVGNNTYTSSLLPMSARLKTAEPSLAVVAREETPVARLDSLREELFPAAQSIYLKLDVQGFEKAVLEGAAGVMDSVVAIELELSTCALYEGQWEIQDALPELHTQGFRCVAMEPVFFDAVTGELLQVDSVLVRSTVLARDSG